MFSLLIYCKDQRGCSRSLHYIIILHVQSCCCCKHIIFKEENCDCLTFKERQTLFSLDTLWGLRSRKLGVKHFFSSVLLFLGTRIIRDCFHWLGITLLCPVSAGKAFGFGFARVSADARQNLSSSSVWTLRFIGGTHQ